MSMNAYLLAVKSGLQTFLDDNRVAVVDISDDGQPPPDCGQVFYGIVGGTIENSSDQSLYETYSLEIVLTLRVPYAPRDRLGTEILTLAPTQTPSQANNASLRSLGGLWPRVEALRAWLHMNYTVMIAANTTIGGSANGFVEPLQFRRATYLGRKGYDWFSAEPSEDDPIAGVAAKLVFDRATRVQTIESMT